MDEDRTKLSPDIRVGTAWPGPGGAGEPRGAAEGDSHVSCLSAAELPLAALPAALAAGLPEGESRASAPFSLSLRLGRHFARVPASPAEIAEYGRALRECRQLAGTAARDGILDALLLELGPSFTYRAETRRHLDMVMRDLEGLPLAIAFFSESWYSSRVIEGLKARGASLCLMDLPRHRAAPPSVDIVTSPLVYIKLYGRNRKAWEEGNAAGLFDYSYDEAELRSWLPRVRALATQAGKIRVIFANGRHGNAIRDARRFAGMLRARPQAEPGKAARDE